MPVLSAQSTFAPKPGRRANRQPACRQWDRGEHSEGEYSRGVLVLSGHADGHEEHGTEVGRVRGEIEIKE